MLFGVQIMSEILGRLHIRPVQLFVPSVPHPLFERQIMSDAKNPPFEIGARLPLSQVLKQSQKYLLDDFFTIGQRQSQRGNVSKQRVPKLPEEIHDLVFQRRWSRYKHSRAPGSI
jgi:hypothetical protein